jgi:hypothetical protein
MGFNFDVTAATATLKSRYTDLKIQTLAYKSKLLARMPKDPTYGGQDYRGTIRFATTTAVSALDTIAYTVGNASQYSQWVVPWKDHYASANITGGAIDRSKGDANALVNDLTGEFDGMFVSLGVALGWQLYGNGGGALGQISSGSTVGSVTITLANISNVTNFQVGMILQASVDDGTGGGGLRSAGATITLTGVDRTLGTLTAAGNWSASIAAIVAGDFLFQNGNYNACFPGLSGWLPAPAYTTANGTVIASKRPIGGDNFLSVNRFPDPIRLAGGYFQGNGAPKEETVLQLAMLVQREGGTPNVMACNPADAVDVIKALESRTIYQNPGTDTSPTVGFEGFKIATAGGMIEVVQDPFCPQGIFYLLQLDTWLLPSIGKIPRVFGKGIDELEWLRNAGADSYQLRGGFRVGSYCSAPGWNGVGTF